MHLHDLEVNRPSRRLCPQQQSIRHRGLITARDIASISLFNK